MSGFDVIKLAIALLAFIIAVVAHEIAHGYAANYYGDDTPRLANRLSLNPLKHISLFGSILIPLVLFFMKAPFLFGFAKPVPVNMGYIIQRHGYKAATFVSLAGVLANLVLATLASLALSGLGNVPMPSSHALALLARLFVLFCANMVLYNVILALFNLIPIPPLDGSAALAYIGLGCGSDIFARYYNALERYGIFIVFFLLFIPGVSEVLFAPMQWLLGVLL